jgi:hypothetical protein
MNPIVSIPLNENAIETGRNGTYFIGSLEIHDNGIEGYESFFIDGRSRNRGNLLNGGIYGLTGEELDQFCKAWLASREETSDES